MRTSPEGMRIWASVPSLAISWALKKNAGRNSYGRITVRHRGGGNKRKYRIIDFKRDKVDMPATVLRLEYDPNRSANIALVEYEDGERRYILAPVGLAAGDKVLSSAAADIKPGNALPLANIPVGTVIHNIEMHPGKGGQLVRSAGPAGRGSRLKCFDRHDSLSSLHHALEELDGLGILGQLHDGLLPLLGAAGAAGAHALGLAGDDHGVDLGNLSSSPLRSTRLWSRARATSPAS